MQPQEHQNSQNDGKIDIIKNIILKARLLHRPSPLALWRYFGNNYTKMAFSILFNLMKRLQV